MRDYCENCPMYWSACDYWGEWDEGCLIHCDGWFKGKGFKLVCHMPVLVKKLYLKYYNWREEIRWERIVREQEEAEALDDLDQLLEE